MFGKLTYRVAGTVEPPEAEETGALDVALGESINGEGAARCVQPVRLPRPLHSFSPNHLSWVIIQKILFIKILGINVGFINSHKYLENLNAIQICLPRRAFYMQK